jgi:phosphoribosyl 1,2-cyclic phosphodiesterase
MRGFCSLASGSKGNCLYLGTEKTKLLIDVGLSLRSIQSKLKEIDVSLEEISAILITHEHSDHILGLKSICQKYEIPVFANSHTAQAIYKILGLCPDFTFFTTGESFTFREITIFPFSTMHDAVDPVGFTFSFEGIKFGICTDCGFVTSLIKHHLRGCHYLFIEANHDPHMVHACPRPLIYKQRVLSRSGHLSNEACKELVQEVLHKDLRQVQLGHLSKECNHPSKALEMVQKALQCSPHPIDLYIATQESIGQKIYF